jgi:hypothetical protein
MEMTWLSWVHQHWPTLCAGGRLEAPPWLRHPSGAGFEPTSLAERVGQVRDWVRSFSDGSRIHIHELGDGRIIVHRDATDPSRGPLEAAWHWVSESRSGRAVAWTAGLVAVALVVRSKLTAAP